HRPEARGAVAEGLTCLRACLKCLPWQVEVFPEVDCLGQPLRLALPDTEGLKLSSEEGPEAQWGQVRAIKQFGLARAGKALRKAAVLVCGGPRIAGLSALKEAGKMP